MHLLRVVDGAGEPHPSLPRRAPKASPKRPKVWPWCLAVPSVLAAAGQEPGAARRTLPPDARRAPTSTSAMSAAPRSPTSRSRAWWAAPTATRSSPTTWRASLAGGAEPAEHLGKIPRSGPETDTLRHEILRLQRMLRELVDCERFEEAAGVRDRLAELGQRLEEGSA